MSQAGIKKIAESEYKFGFSTDVDTVDFPVGLNEEVVEKISAIKAEPAWLLESRLKAYRYWLTLDPPKWAHINHPEIDYQAIQYYSAPKSTEDKPESLDDVDPELLKTFEKLGIPLSEQKRLTGVAVDAVFDSVSIGTTFRKELAEVGVIFCSFSEAVQEHPELVKEYLGKVVPYKDNYFAALNAAVFTDGSFCYIPKGVRCPLDLSTYFRINAAGTGQFERTLLIADEGSYVSYLEGCTAPQRDENQLHAAVVELYAHKNAEIKYSTVQNWYAGDAEGKGGIYNFVTKRGVCAGDDSKISWTQVEAGSAITWKYPSCILKGKRSTGEFYSVALTNQKMEADTGTKMIHLGAGTKSRIVSKGISADKSLQSYRGLVKIGKEAHGAQNFSQCDSMLIGGECTANTYPYIEAHNKKSKIEHEASTSRVSADQLFYLQSRGLSEEESVSLLVNGFCKEVFNQLPLEFSVEAVKLLEMKLEGAVG